MSRADAVKALNALRRGDNEKGHAEADGILLQFLEDNGFSEIAEAWELAADRLDFWYS